MPTPKQQMIIGYKLHYRRVHYYICNEGLPIEHHKANSSVSFSLNDVGTSVSVVSVVTTMMEEVLLIGCTFEIFAVEIVDINKPILQFLSVVNGSKSTVDGKNIVNNSKGLLTCVWL